MATRRRCVGQRRRRRLHASRPREGACRGAATSGSRVEAWPAWRDDRRARAAHPLTRARAAGGAPALARRVRRVGARLRRRHNRAPGQLRRHHGGNSGPSSRDAARRAPRAARAQRSVPELLEWNDHAPDLGRALEQRGRFCGPARLLHGDFWPGNLLWRNSLLVAVLDWEDAAIGDPLSDLACARAELACAAGEAVSRRFTDEYLQQTGLDASRLPVWDLYVSTAALMSMDQWGLPPDRLAARRGATQAFRDRAAAVLGIV
jgi:hypothetical protein